MILRLTGLLESIDDHSATVVPLHADGAPGPIAYQVLLPHYLAVRLTGDGAIGRPITLHTLQYLESPDQGSSFAPRLLGFATPREREFFELFTTVKGLGTKRALNAMALEPGAIAAAITNRDARSLKELPKIGPRLAETIIAELHGKADGFADLDSVPGAGTGRRAGGGSSALSPAAEEAVGALVSLGETRVDAERLVIRVMTKRTDLAETGAILQAALGSR
ncbi:MAG: hypothetical protein KF745_12100 [Phycisphaeraceae bacterium]|nr:hypothetical protein [Phycisphaeraceae bacterium]